MRKPAAILITLLLVAVIALQILAALNIFPKQERVKICPVDAISMQNGKAVIDKTNCIGCRRCVAGVMVPSGYLEQNSELVVDSRLLYRETWYSGYKSTIGKDRGNQENSGFEKDS
ncbi:MAG TPA: hypothetical protein PLL58_01440 [Candidatus Syntrophosphaera sp.]|nr:hypothetical protein [Candidatus Syntrophosphaera sp.]